MEKSDTLNQKTMEFDTLDQKTMEFDALNQKNNGVSGIWYLEPKNNKKMIPGTKKVIFA
jgi:hypothetical protein